MFYFFYRPCIIFFDSYYSNTGKVESNLRNYLDIEYHEKKSHSAKKKSHSASQVAVNLFPNEIMASVCAKVFKQNNAYDCGVFVIQFAEFFLTVSFFIIY